MGDLMCKSAAVREQQSRNAKIEREIQSAKAHQLKQSKLLLLGPAECGKSTILKQMIILHRNGFTEEEIQEKKSVIYSNTLTSLAAILRAMETLDIELENPEREVDVRIIHRVIEVGDMFMEWTDEVFSALKQLWDDQGVKESYERRSQYQVNDSAGYFLDSLDRINAPGFKPTDQDILRSRVATTGVSEVKFMIGSRDLRVYDVGGQKSERRKWINCFDQVNAVIFMVAISEYDQTLFEDETTNRMEDSICLYTSLCNSHWFINSSMILFLNKKDLFAEKINKNISIKSCFPDYEGAQTYDDSVGFIKAKFKALNANPDKTIYQHETCATDTDQVSKVIADVVEMVIKRNTKKMGM